MEMLYPRPGLPRTWACPENWSQSQVPQSLIPRLCVPCVLPSSPRCLIAQGRATGLNSLFPKCTQPTREGDHRPKTYSMHKVDKNTAYRVRLGNAATHPGDLFSAFPLKRAHPRICIWLSGLVSSNPVICYGLKMGSSPHPAGMGLSIAL